jgi:hypothetical protein
MVVPVLSLGQAGGPPREPDWEKFAWTTALLGCVCLVGAVLFWLLNRWRQRTRENRLTSADQLTQFRQLYEEGELSAEEFARIRGRLTGRLIQELDKAPAPERPAPEPPQPPNPTP